MLRTEMIDELQERRESSGKSISAMGLVNREGDCFRVSTSPLHGRPTSFDVKRDDAGYIRCNCLEFEEAVIEEVTFRCEHILAVKFALIDQNTEAVKKKNPLEVKTEVTDSNTKDKNATELGESTPGEQKTNQIQADVSSYGQTETIEKLVQNQLANTKGKNNMTRNKLKEMPFVMAEEAKQFDELADNAPETEVGNSNNVLDFPTKLKQLRKDVSPNLVKQRQACTNRNGESQTVDYVEWHTVADILDETTPNWMHTVKGIKQIGNIITATVAITIDGVTREGIGTGLADSEMGIKKAELDALKRAAVKFGIARELYKKESVSIEGEGAVSANANNNENILPTNPIAKSLSDLVSTKQLRMIRAISREIGLEADDELNNLTSCQTGDLSKRAASSFIQHLQNLKQKAQTDFQPMRRAG